jgi:hypothetical protein
MDLKQVFDQLIEIKGLQGQIMSTQRAIEENLEYHIKRTDLLEKKVDFTTRSVHMAHGALAVIGALATAIGIWAKLG